MCTCSTMMCSLWLQCRTIEFSTGAKGAPFPSTSCSTIPRHVEFGQARLYILRDLSLAPLPSVPQRLGLVLMVSCQFSLCRLGHRQSLAVAMKFGIGSVRDSALAGILETLNGDYWLTVTVRAVAPARGVYPRLPTSAGECRKSARRLPGCARVRMCPAP